MRAVSRSGSPSVACSDRSPTSLTSRLSPLVNENVEVSGNLASVYSLISDSMVAHNLHTRTRYPKVQTKLCSLRGRSQATQYLTRT